MRRRRKRLGFALLLAVCLLATIGGLAGASFFAVREARRAATRFASQEAAAAAADTELFATLASWDALARDTLVVGATDSADPGALPSRSYVTRITQALYSVTAVGRSAVGTSVEARRAHNLLVAVRPPLVPAGAAIVSAGDVTVSRDAVLSGDDRAPPGWGDCPPPDSVRGPTVIVPEGATARDDAGVPLAAARLDPMAADSATYSAFGPVSAAVLAARADVELPAGVMLSPRPSMGDACGSDGDNTSWGEPLPIAASPRCRRYFPIIHAAGDIVVTAGSGQGFLIVDGRLRIEGPFVFNGVIVAAHGVEARGLGVTVYGTVLSAGTSGVRWLAAGRVQRSMCAVARASTAAAGPLPVERRAWSELF